ncbi:MAG TPA: E2/UBC family protein, partial [Emticicia sp.]
IHDYAIPEGYTIQKADIALLIAPTYSATEIDMAHFSPPLSKTSGRGISATSNHVIDGKNFQQWSRHRQAGEWRPGVDNISTHLCLVENWLTRDLER